MKTLLVCSLLLFAVGLLIFPQCASAQFYASNSIYYDGSGTVYATAYTFAGGFYDPVVNVTLYGPAGGYRYDWSDFEVEVSMDVADYGFGDYSVESSHLVRTFLGFDPYGILSGPYYGGQWDYSEGWGVFTPSCFFYYNDACGSGVGGIYGEYWMGELYSDAYVPPPVPTVSIQGPGYVYIGHDFQVTHYINGLFGLGSPGGGSYEWSSPDSSISFDNSANAVVHVTATSYSGGTNDTEITLKYTSNGQSAQTAVSLTKRLFYYLAGDSLILYASYNGPSKYGYTYLAYYNVFTHPDRLQVSDGEGVSTDENVTQLSSNVAITPVYAD